MRQRESGVDRDNLVVRQTGSGAEGRLGSETEREWGKSGQLFGDREQVGQRGTVGSATEREWDREGRLGSET